VNEALRKHPALGSLLKSWRRQVRLTQEEVASAVSARRGRELTPNWYAKLENRGNAYPSDEDLDHILAVLGRTRWEAEQALGGGSITALADLADATPEPRGGAPSWSADVAVTPPAVPPAAPRGSAVPESPGPESPGAGLRGAARLESAAAYGAPTSASADDDLRAALRRFGLSDAAAEEALAYVRSLRARPQRRE
jgi:transcriptional regulator with XRE-family HTH domain